MTFLATEQNLAVLMCDIFFMVAVGGPLGWPLFLAVLNEAAINTHVQIPCAMLA